MAEIGGRSPRPEELQALALTNYGHFTSFRVEDGRVRGLSLHLERLNADCQVVFGTPLDLANVRELVRRAAPRAGIATIRVTVFDPSIDLGHPADAVNPQVLVTERPASALPLPALRVQSTIYARSEPEIKSVALFGSLRQRRSAQLNGFDDALFVDEGGIVSEGGTWNIGFFDGQHIVWPEGPSLPGITMRLLRSANHKTAPLHLNDLRSMECAFATNAAIGVRAISQIDDRSFPDGGKEIDRLREMYLGIEGEEL